MNPRENKPLKSALRKESVRSFPWELVDLVIAEEERKGEEEAAAFRAKYGKELPREYWPSD